MNFASDNVAGVTPEILEAMIRANCGTEPSYGDDRISQTVAAQFTEVFEHDLIMMPMATGSAANALALSVYTPPWGAIYAHASAHIQEDECGAPEFFCNGAKIVPIEGEQGKIPLEGLARQLARGWRGYVHHVQPACLSLTQLTETGTAYSLEELRALTRLAHDHGLKVHMDGARFANALVTLGCSPADMSWRVGVDVLSFGATKNGAMGAEAVLFFNQADRAEVEFRRKRAGHLLSKMRFLTAQLGAYLDQDHWLHQARHANAMTQRLRQGLHELPGTRILYPVDGNELFISLPEAAVAGLEALGFVFYRWPAEPPKTGDREGRANHPAIRLVCSWSTTIDEVDHLLQAAGRLLAQNT